MHIVKNTLTQTHVYLSGRDVLQIIFIYLTSKINVVHPVKHFFHPNKIHILLLKKLYTLLFNTNAYFILNERNKMPNKYLRI